MVRRQKSPVSRRFSTPSNVTYIGGYTYCAVAALSLLGRPSDPSEPRSDSFLSAGVPRRHELLKFLSHRQFSYLTEDEEECEDEENFIQSQLDELNLNQEPQYVGMNGRWNKKADTCYYWWAAGALAVSITQLLSYCLSRHSGF